MDHSVKAMSGHRKMRFSRLLNRHRFENDELEGLFQRYIFKLQHSSISSFVALFIVLTAVLAAISFVLEQTPTLTNMYNSVHCLFFVVIFVFLATKVCMHERSVSTFHLKAAFNILHAENWNFEFTFFQTMG